MHLFQSHLGFSLLAVFIGAFIALDLFLKYLLTPLRIRNRRWRDANPEFRDLQFEHIPLDLRQKFDEVAPQLSSLGFVLDGVVKKVKDSDGQVTCVSLWVNSMTRDIVQIIAIRGAERHDGTRRIPVLVTFRQEYEDDTQIVTTNSSTAGIFPWDPRVDSVTCSGVWNIPLLHEFHRARCESDRRGRTARLPQDGTICYLNADWTKTFQRLCREGYYREDKNHARYCPTIKGAFIMTWRLLWPLKQIRLRRREQDADRQLRRFGFSGLPGFKARAKGPPPLPAGR